jgi:cytochrome c-type biogenesis protein CcmE
MTPQLQRRIFAVGAIAIAAVALGVVSMGNLGENLVYYWSPTELHANADKALGATVRLGGQVQTGSLNWDRKARHATFTVTDGASEVPVVCSSNPPQMFREGIGVVVEGTLQADGVFTSDRVMVKHSNEYRAPGDGETPEDIYGELNRTFEGGS